MRWSLQRWAFLAGLLAILLVGFWARISVYPEVLGTGDLVPRTDGDSHYHLDRTLDAAANFPRVRHFDPRMNWPKGAFCPWADGFDLAGAGFALLMAGRDPLRAPIAVALWPVVLGLLVVWATVRMVRVALPGAGWRGAALAAGLSAALIPVGVHHSSLGRVDHHVFEALLVAMLATWVLRRFPAHPGERPPRTIGFELEGALLSGLGVYGFTGSPVYVALAVLPLAWVALSDGRALGSGGPGLVAGGALSAVLSTPAVLDHRLLLSFKFPSLLQPALLVGGGLAIVTCAWIGAAAPGRRRTRLLWSASALLVLAAAGAAVAAPAVGEVNQALTGWLLHQDPWISTIREFTPLFGEMKDGSPAWARLYWAMGFSGFFLPLAAIVVAARLGWRPRVAVLVYFAVAMAVLTFVQVRFDRPSVPLVATVTALALATALRSLGSRWRWSRGLVLPPVVLGLFLLADPPSRDSLARASRIGREPVQEMAVHLRDSPLPASQAMGVLTNWSYGHHLQVQGGVPVAVNGFGSYLDGPAFWRAVEVFRGGADGLDDFMLDQRFGALLAGAATIGQEVTGAGGSLSFSMGQLNREYMTSIRLSPLLIAGSAVPGWNVRHLPHLMPRRASHAYVAGLAFTLPFLWSYERVQGAVVRGTAPAGARVIAELRFAEHDRPHTYKAWVDADDDRAWSLTLPFPSGMLRPAFRSEPRWTVSTGGGEPVAFELPEGAVRAGSTIDVGSLRPRP